MTTPCGQTFESEALREWRTRNNRCPSCRVLIPTDVALRDMIASWRVLQQRLSESQQNPLAMDTLSISMDQITVDTARPLGRGSHGIVKKGGFLGNRVK